MNGWYAPVGVIGLRRRPKEHGCGDWCHDDEWEALRRRRIWLAAEVWPGEFRRVLEIGLKHCCGPWCTTKDPVTPVRLGGSDLPVSDGLDFLSPTSRDLLARLRARA